MMKLMILGALTLAVLTAPCIAEEGCTDKPECWPEGSSMRTMLEQSAKHKKTDEQIASQFASLVNLVQQSRPSGETRLTDALRAQQAAWSSYRVAECELIGSLTGAGGTWPSTHAARCEANHGDARLRHIRSAIRCIQSIPEAQRAYDLDHCLQQLAPLTNPAQSSHTKTNVPTSP